MLIAIRDDENRVRFSGYNPTWFKVLVFGVSGAIAGIAGAFYTVQTGIITPSSMEVGFSIEMVIWVAVGGRATLVGAIIGTLIVRIAQTFLSEQFPEVWLFFQGALFLSVVTVLPTGIIGGMKDLINHWFFRPKLTTYPGIDLDPEVQQEREQFNHDH
jgi:urea transport system permease protein